MAATRLFDGGRRERLLFCVLAVALVGVRTFVATYYEGFYFDSDQAIVGLMARHIAALHDFPIFFYGQSYLLGVQAWIAAPFFAFGRSSVALLRLPFVLLNAAVAVAFVVMIAGRAKVRPAFAFVAALPFIVPTPATANQLLDLSGACVEPIAYALILWTLRRRPALFGAVLAVAFLHREFILAVVPAVVVVELLLSHAWTRENWRPAAYGAAGFFVTWLVIDDLKLRESGSALGQQAAMLAGKTCFEPGAVTDGIRELLTTAVPVLYGAKAYPIRSFRMDSPLVGGSAAVAVLVLAALALIAWRIAANWRAVRTDKTAALGLFLALTGLFAASVYPLSCDIRVGLPPLLRFLLLALLIPIGAAAAFFAVERAARWRAAVAALFLLWAAANLVDNMRLIRLASIEPPLNERRALIEYLGDHHIRYARAIYWDAYIIDFLSRERVLTASMDTIRIPEYQKEVNDHAADAVYLERQPCDEGARVGAWCVHK
ncbi:MAG TPA: hypothetical protein VEU08_15205 [Vicinamibacterales bacterium]|nr:hypothetical protein [Vicinamibacterales bacterium]